MEREAVEGRPTPQRGIRMRRVERVSKAETVMVHYFINVQEIAFTRSRLPDGSRSY